MIQDIAPERILEKYGKVCYSCDHLGCDKHDKTEIGARFWCTKKAVNFTFGLKGAKKIYCDDNWVLIDHTN